MRNKYICEDRLELKRLSFGLLFTMIHLHPILCLHIVSCTAESVWISEEIFGSTFCLPFILHYSMPMDPSAFTYLIWKYWRLLTIASSGRGPLLCTRLTVWFKHDGEFFKGLTLYTGNNCVVTNAKLRVNEVQCSLIRVSGAFGKNSLSK